MGDAPEPGPKAPSFPRATVGQGRGLGIGEVWFMVLPRRFELRTSPLPRECSTPELRQPVQYSREILAIGASRKPDLDGFSPLG